MAVLGILELSCQGLGILKLLECQYLVSVQDQQEKKTEVRLGTKKIYISVQIEICPFRPSILRRERAECRRAGVWARGPERTEGQNETRG